MISVIKTFQSQEEMVTKRLKERFAAPLSGLKIMAIVMVLHIHREEIREAQESRFSYSPKDPTVKRPAYSALARHVLASQGEIQWMSTRQERRAIKFLFEERYVPDGGVFERFVKEWVLNV